MNDLFQALVVCLLTLSQAIAAEPEREWMADDEVGQKIFGREVILPSSVMPEMIKALDQYAPTNRSSFTELKTKLQEPTKLTIMDVAAVASLEKKEIAWFYDLLATNKDPVVRFFGLTPKVMVLKDRSAATNLYELPRSGLNSSDKWLVENCLHGIGIDPYSDAPEAIFEFLSSMRDKKQPPVGSVAKDFETATLDGKKIKLSHFAGKPVLLHFWSTTCGPCISEMPDLETELQSLKNAHPDLVVLGVSLDDNLKQLNTFLKKYDVTWTDVCDKRGWGGQAAKAFHITGIPSDVVIDRDGKIAGYSRTALPTLLSR